jgi:stage V sporulation protein K
MRVNFNFGGTNESRKKLLVNNKPRCIEKNSFNELNELVGLKDVKKLLKELKAYVLIQKARKKENLITEKLVLHMIFKGNPGTGKTTVARILAKFFKEVGILDQGHLVEVERADLVGEYIGHTAQRTKEHIRKAMGGILFIDEAYSLARGGERDFGREAIDCLVKGMEDNKDNLIIILAGYQNEMEKFILTNPGIRSRFPIHLNFRDYNLDELIAIAKLMLNKKQYILEFEAELKLKKILRQYILSGLISNGNARYVRNIIEHAIRYQAYRLIENKEKLDKTNLLYITENDIKNNIMNHTITF